MSKSGGGMSNSQKEEEEAVKSGYWINYRYDPRLKEQNKNPFILDSKEPSLELEKFLEKQQRYDYLKKASPEISKKLVDELKQYLEERLNFYKKLSGK